MAKHDPIVERPRGSSWRTSANAPDALRRQLYQQMLRDELGRDPDFRQAAPREPSLWGSPVVIGALAILTFLGVLGGLLWRDGVFDRALRWPTQAEPSRGWMLGDKTRAVADANASAPFESFVEDAPVVSAEDRTAEAAPE